MRAEVPQLFQAEVAGSKAPVAAHAKELLEARTPSAMPDNELARTLVEMPAAERQAYLEGLVMNVVKDLTSETSLTAETPLMEAGIDSLAATELVWRMTELSGLSLAPTLMFAFPSSRKIAAHLLEELGVEKHLCAA